MLHRDCSVEITVRNFVEDETVIGVMNFLSLEFLAHSHLYYNLDKNVVSDEFFDKLSKELSYLIHKFPDTWSKSRYGNVFFDNIEELNEFVETKETISTGAGFYEALSAHQRYRVDIVAEHMLKLIGVL